MTDTLQISLNGFDIRPDHGLTIQPPAYVPRTGEMIGDFRLWKGVQGRAAFYNDKRFNLDVKPFQGQVRALLHLSLPGYGSPDNVDPLTKTQAGEVMEDVQRSLDGLGVDCNVMNARVSRLDAFRNVTTSEPFTTYAPVLGLLEGKRLRDFVQFGGSAFRWGNTLSQVNAYDKVHEMESKKKNTDRFAGQNILRFEHRSLKSRKVRDLYGFATVSDFLREYDSVGDVYRRTMKDVLFRVQGEEVEVLSQKQIEEELRLFKEASGRYWLSDYLQAVGMKSLLQRSSVDTIGKAVAAVSGNRSVAWKNRRKLQRSLIHQKMLTKSDVSVRTFRALYDELQAGVLAA